MKKIKNFLYVNDVQEILGVGVTNAYEIIQQLNDELKEKGYLTFKGRVSARYLKERYAI